MDWTQEDKEAEIVEAGSTGDASENEAPKLEEANVETHADVKTEADVKTAANVKSDVAPAKEAAPEASGEEASKRKISTRSDLKWYIINAQTSLEARAKNSLEEAIVRAKKEDEFGEILIPVESVVELVKGQRKSTERKFFPGYMLVQMLLTDENWHIVKTTPRVSGFVGNARKPPAIPPKEVERIMGQMVEGRQQAKPKYTFKEGDNVRVIDGPFANFNGTVEEVKPEKSKLRVLVSIFGRATPIELDFIQVEKT